ncbi:hypothetical protein VT84_14775 [Gemmata sp. SH-PL17]|uniref:hypothetical protein n=1 Tax=Gemmata sp. SH-PL17 TaxID=1630693 RepID=UPI00078EB9C3|nr:hypothetical protein [Gemmata sp. SH-PL17]AMV25659.1 hypothetical protein VT84_14775 [Gemmata sp. SH-PL17]
MSESEQPTGVVYFVSMASRRTDGAITIPTASVYRGRPFGRVITVETRDSHYEFWQWLVDNPKLFPRVDDDNVPVALAAFANRK